MKPVRLRLTCNAQPLLAALAAVSALAEQSRKGVLRLGDLGEELVAVQLDHPATATASELGIRLEPSDGLRGFVSALGAGNVD